MNHKGPATRIIHNRRHMDQFGSPYSPVYNTTTYRFENTAALLDVMKGAAKATCTPAGAPTRAFVNWNRDWPGWSRRKRHWLLARAWRRFLPPYWPTAARALSVWGTFTAAPRNCLKITAWPWADRKSTRLNSSHVRISYAVFCLK